MRLLVLRILVLLLSSNLFAQIHLDTKLLKKALKPIEVQDTISTHLTLKNPFDIAEIYSESWDTLQFNPYKEAKPKFPLQINFFDTNYTSPITRKKVITSRYGWRKGKAHQGIDIDLVTGDSVLSMLDGIVRFAKYNSGHGNTVIVRHYNGLETVYAHLSEYAVKVNDTVKQGQLLGKGGATGNARGSHLHLVVSYKGHYIHPEYIFDFSPENTIRANELWITREFTQPSFYNSKRIADLDLLLSEDDALARLQKQKTLYIVKSGDTLSRIALRNNMSVAAICKANNLTTKSIIKVGQKLVL
jgi:murein DD-endopeptidase MepM/ murein hydrolase activator NlpD